ncbi:glycosyltransferase [Helicobacter saguini]|uniref:glycosyltransferase family 2 protein n=1 Tax=Helicobacter saguini TaxID=1548018 RepID=UPI000E59B707|nr:glycosyltransferase family 2 protein [Helicobacter saguini]MWV62092.1 glycosyltransferase [Helicobacter saguini]
MSYLEAKRSDLSREEQLDIIFQVDKEYARHFEKDFDDSIFYRKIDNFAPKAHIESVCLAKQDLKSKPRFSIAIPNYRRIEQLKRAIDSALNQDFDEEYEILVVENTDDFNDNSVFDAIIKDYKGKISYYKNKENLGLFGNWNRCFLLSQGEWMCCLHSDDMLLPPYLKEMRKLVDMDKYADAALIGCITTHGIHNFKKRHKFIRNFIPNAYLDRAMGAWGWFGVPNNNGGGGILSFSHLLYILTQDYTTKKSA